jgi:hypothetical protein
LGLKSEFNDLLHANVALFDSRRKDVQYAIPVSTLFDQTFELHRVTVTGATLDVHSSPLHDLALSASATYLHRRIDRADAAAGTVFDPSSTSGSPYTLGENIRDVFALPYTPRFAASVAGRVLSLARRAAPAPRRASNAA